MLGDRMIGSFIGGQVLAEEPDLERMRQVAKEIGVDEEEFLEAAKKGSDYPESRNRPLHQLYLRICGRNLEYGVQVLRNHTVLRSSPRSKNPTFSRI